MSKSNNHRTTNLYEASFLIAKNFKVEKLERDSRSKVIVCLEGKNIEDAVNDYYNGGLVSGKSMTDAYRTLKDRIFE